MNNGKIIHLMGHFKLVAIGSMLMVIFSVGCSSQPTPTSMPKPMWSEAEAIAVVKGRCSPLGSICGNELVTLTDEKWSAVYEPNAKRWAVSVVGQQLFSSQPPLHIVSYVYENTQTVEWYVNR